MKRSGRILPKSKEQAKRWSEWKFRRKPDFIPPEGSVETVRTDVIQAHLKRRRAKPIGRVLSVKVGLRGLAYKAQLSVHGFSQIKKWAKPTAQRKKTLARERELREWFWGIVAEWQQMLETTGKPWRRIKQLDPGVCGRCGSFGELDVDHTEGRGPHKWEGWLLQVLCAFCNRYVKRSSKGPAWDFRSEHFKGFLLRAWHRDWSKDWHGRWIRQGQGSEYNKP